MPQKTANQITMMLLLFTLVGGAILLFGGNIPELEAIMALAFALKLAIVVMVIIMLVLQFSPACPNCEYIFTSDETSKQETGSTLGYRTITRTIKNKDQEDEHNYQEQIRVKTVEYVHRHSCNHCGHQWETTSKQEMQDFDE